MNIQIPLYRRTGPIGVTENIHYANCSYPLINTSDVGCMLVLSVVYKPYTNGDYLQTPSGWTAVSYNTTAFGLGTNGVADQGTVTAAMWYKISTGTESGLVVPEFTSPAKLLYCSQACISVYSKPPDSEWDIPVCCYGWQETAGVGINWFTTSNVGTMDCSSGDLILSLTGVNSNILDTYSFYYNSYLWQGDPLDDGDYTRFIDRIFEWETNNPDASYGKYLGTHQELALQNQKVDWGYENYDAYRSFEVRATTTPVTVYSPTGVTIQMRLRCIPWRTTLKRWDSNNAEWKRAELNRFKSPNFETMSNTPGKTLNRYTGADWKGVSCLWANFGNDNSNKVITVPKFKSMGNEIQDISIFTGHQFNLWSNAPWIHTKTSTGHGDSSIYIYCEDYGSIVDPPLTRDASIFILLDYNDDGSLKPENIYSHINISQTWPYAGFSGSYSGPTTFSDAGGACDEAVFDVNANSPWQIVVSGTIASVLNISVDYWDEPPYSYNAIYATSNTFWTTNLDGSINIYTLDDLVTPKDSLSVYFRETCS